MYKTDAPADISAKLLYKLTCLSTSIYELSHCSNYSLGWRASAIYSGVGVSRVRRYGASPAARAASKAGEDK